MTYPSWVGPRCRRLVSTPRLATGLKELVTPRLVMLRSRERIYLTSLLPFDNLSPFVYGHCNLNKIEKSKGGEMKKQFFLSLQILLLFTSGIPSYANEAKTCVDNVEVEFCSIDDNFAKFAGGYSIEVLPPGSISRMMVESDNGYSIQLTVESDADGNVFTLIEENAAKFSLYADVLTTPTNTISTTNCGSGTHYNLDSHLPVAQPFQWWYNSSNQPASNSIYRIGEAFQTWKAGENRCNGTIIPNSYNPVYMGSTNKALALEYYPLPTNPDIGTYACPSADTTYKNIIGWKSISKGDLAITCSSRFYAGPWMFSVALNTKYSWYSTYDMASCSGQIDLKATATHEIGHTFGLDEFQYATQAMYQVGSNCVMTRRGLGYGDVHGIAKIYP